MSVLKVLSELSPVLLARGNDASGGDDGQLDEKRRKMGQEEVRAEEMDDEGQVFTVIAGSLLPRSVLFFFLHSFNAVFCETDCVYVTSCHMPASRNIYQPQWLLLEKFPSLQSDDLG